MADDEGDPSTFANDKNEKDKSELKHNSNGPVYGSVNEYCVAVNQWLWQYYYAQCFAASLPYYFISTCHQQAQNGSTDVNRNITAGNFFQSQTPQQHSGNTFGNTRLLGREYLLPPLWKRFVAEVIDFFILLILKLMVTYIAVDFFEIIDLEKYDLDILREDRIDYKVALQMTSEILMLEIIHRFVVCIFEALCLHHGTMEPGGATPGKSFLGLRVVKCLALEQLDNNVIRVYPAKDIGIGWALLRAFIKNFSLAFFLPICLTLLYFQHNRTAYDMLCKCIVVQDIPRRPQQPH